MWQRRVRTGRRNSHGVAPIRRESYSTVNGFTQKDGWWEVRKKIEKRSGGKCEALISGARCGAKGTDVHHIIPLSKGGTNSPSNLIMLCLACHEKRHRHLFRAGYSK